MPEEQEARGRLCPPHGIALTSDESELWVCSILHEFVAVFDLSTEPPKQIARFPTKIDPPLADLCARRAVLLRL